MAEYDAGPYLIRYSNGECYEVVFGVTSKGARKILDAHYGKGYQRWVRFRRLLAWVGIGALVAGVLLWVS